MADFDDTAYRVAALETADVSKFNNMLTALKASLNDIEDAQIAANAAIAVSKLAAGAASSFLRTVGGVPVWENGAWTSYTPAWFGGSPSIGNGLLTGDYIQLGKLVVARIHLLAGSTTTFGAGVWSFGIPVACLTGEQLCVGTAIAQDTGTASYFGRVDLTSSTVINIRCQQTTGSYAQDIDTTPTVPFTWANGDALDASFVYEAA